VQSPNVKGAVAELAVAKAAAELGLAVYGPLTEHARYDLVIEIAGKPRRIQCKWGRLEDDGHVIVCQIGGSRLTPTGYLRTVYTPDEVDFVAVYCGALDTVYLLPSEVFAGRVEVTLRAAPARNGQRASVNLASDFEFHGAIAQLEERRHGMAEVVGSSPTSSTPADPTVVGANEFRNRFGWYMERAAAGEEFLVERRGKPYVRLAGASGQVPLLNAA
jgi:prevent-host-death family protein